MVRKIVRTVDGLASNQAPYPTTPVLPNEWSTETPGITSLESHKLDSPKELSCHDDSVDGSDTTNAWATISQQDRTDFHGRELSSGRSEQVMGGDKLPGSDSLPSSLRAGFADLTPRSSFESQTSATAAGKPIPNIEATASSSEPYTQNANSNNPYLRLKFGDSALAGGPNLDGDNSANIWASNSDHNVQDVQVSAKNSLNTIRAEPFAEPFAEPWFDFASSPTERSSAQAARPTHNNFASILNPYEELSGNPFEGLDAFEENQVAKKEAFDLSNKMPSTSSEKVRLEEIEGPPRTSSKSALQSPADEEKPLQPLLIQHGHDLPGLPPRLPAKERDGASSVQPLGAVPEGSAEHDSNAQITQSSDDTLQQRGAQRNETYQIKVINWNDSVDTDHLRKSPIMVQNANGPCPLLALVNALTLSTPGDAETPLVETLRTREHVSLGLLLDAVLDELMSGRRGGSAQTLPDVSDLYSFLITLHTGMNVNPSFVSPENKTTSLLDEPIFDSLNNFDTSNNPGGFENTREMRLYSTFAVPLIHGWIPPRDHVALGALQRSAKTYEEAQTLLFREEEIEDKLRRQGLTAEEQIMLEDVASVKYFLTTSATQLTAYGLQCISESLRPGSIAILFRNDHFSTLYKHPQSGQLLSLVTDMGYAGHDEVVWESLVDVTGEGCEYFAGDFRPVGNVAGDTHSSSNHANPDNHAGWSTVSRSNRGARARESSTGNSLGAQNASESGILSNGFSLLSIDEPVSSPLSSKAEQEDHDLALAMQLQEEEEDRERRATAARRRNDRLSQAYIDSQPAYNRRTSNQNNGGQRPSTTSRGSGQDARPTVPPRVEGQSMRKAGNNSDDDLPPPTYEQAAKGPAYHPPEDHPTQSHTPLPNAAMAGQHQHQQQQQHMGPYRQHPPNLRVIPGAFPNPTRGGGRNFFSNSPTSATSSAMGQGNNNGNSNVHVTMNRRSRHDAAGGGGGFRRGGDGTSRGNNSGEDDEKSCSLM